MKEQSHKDEMSAALRGDFKRLRERGVATTLSPDEPDKLDQRVDGEEDVAAVRVSPSDAHPDEESAPEPPAGEPEPDPEPEPQQGWLDRLLGR